MRILITGGFGFVGGRLAQYLAARGARVVLGSRRMQVPPCWLPRAETVQTVWDDNDQLDRMCRGVEVLIHAAGMNAGDCSANPSDALVANGVATSRLIEAAVRSRVRRFFYLSTAHIYASPLAGTITEDSCPRNLHPYATSHLAGEYALQHAIANQRIEGATLRLSNVFGAPAHAGANCWMLLVNDLCLQAIEKGKISLNTSGVQLRDFVAMDVVCKVFEKLIKYKDIQRIGPVLNVGSGCARSVLSMAELIQERCQHVLAKRPALVAPQSLGSETLATLALSVKKLNELGIPSNTGSVEEIDRLLVFCKETFFNRSNGIGS